MNIESKLWQWSIDIWSLGVIILEMLIGFPIWMSYKGRVIRGKICSQNLMVGIFGVTGRPPLKIAKLQKEMCYNIEAFLKK